MITTETNMTTEEMLGIQYDALGHYLVDNVYTEIRHIRDHYSKWVQSKEEYIEEAKKLVGSDVYVGINPRSNKSGSASDVHSVGCLVLDIDPVRVPGMASTDEQHDGAMQIGSRIAEEKFGSVCVSSGSGCHVYFPIAPIKVTNGPLLTNSLAKWMAEFRSRYATKAFKVDSIFDLPRVIRIWGSHNTKSNRICAPLGTPRTITRFAWQFAQTEESSKIDKPALALSDLEDRFQRLVRTNSRLKGITDGTITHESDRSASDFEFIRLLVVAGFSESDIQELVRHNPSGRYTDNTKDISKDVERVYHKVLERLKELQSGNNDELGSRDNADVGYKAADVTPKSLLRDSEEYITSLNSRRPGTSTGLYAFDELTSGLKPSKLYIFAARPGEGKTSLITQILTHVAERGKTCLFYPTEVGAEPIWDKIVSSKSDVYLKHFQNGTFSESDKVKIKDTMGKLKSLPLMIMEDFSVTVTKVESGIKKYAPQVVAIDFLQTMAFKDQDHAGEKYETVRKLKELAIKYNIPIILASQLSRKEGEATLASLSGTKGLEEFGDVISFIKQIDKTGYPTIAELTVMKSKYSSTGSVRLKFYVSTCRIEVDETWKGEETCKTTT